MSNIKIYPSTSDFEKWVATSDVNDGPIITAYGNSRATALLSLAAIMHADDLKDALFPGQNNSNVVPQSDVARVSATALPVGSKVVETAFVSAANVKEQVGGQHYRQAAVQHWDFAALQKMDYFQGQITKYVVRWKKKNGLEDLKKAQHFLEKYMEVWTEFAPCTCAETDGKKCMIPLHQPAK